MTKRTQHCDSIQNGLVTGMNIGSATIRVTCNANTSEYADCEITVTAPTLPDAEKVEIDKAVLDIGYAEGDSNSAVTGNLNLTVSGAVYGSAISWVSSNTRVVQIHENTGTVIRPSYEEGNRNVTLTATIQYNEASVTKAFNLTVLARAQENTGGDTGDDDNDSGNTGGNNSGTPAVTPNPAVTPTPVPTPVLTPTPAPSIKVENDNSIKASVETNADTDDNGKTTALVTGEQINAAVEKLISEKKTDRKVSFQRCKSK